MSDKLSGGRIAREMKTLVQEACGPIAPGESIKAQINRAWINLKRPAFWRVREAWYGDAEKWSAEAVADFKDRLATFKASQDRIDDARKLATLEMGARLRRLREALARADSDFYGSEIDALDHFFGRRGD